MSLKSIKMKMNLAMRNTIQDDAILQLSCRFGDKDDFSID